MNWFNRSGIFIMTITLFGISMIDLADASDKSTIIFIGDNGVISPKNTLSVDLASQGVKRLQFLDRSNHVIKEIDLGFRSGKNVSAFVTPDFQRAIIYEEEYSAQWRDPKNYPRVRKTNIRFYGTTGEEWCSLNTYFVPIVLAEEGKTLAALAGGFDPAELSEKFHISISPSNRYLTETQIAVINDQCKVAFSTTTSNPPSFIRLSPNGSRLSFDQDTIGLSSPGNVTRKYALFNLENGLNDRVQTDLTLDRVRNDGGVEFVKHEGRKRTTPSSKSQIENVNSQKVHKRYEWSSGMNSPKEMSEETR
jgi:hypothetical protein